ncbi:MAG: hypothetical protein ACRD06_06190, partial [Terriglobia bacterium]
VESYQLLYNGHNGHPTSAPAPEATVMSRPLRRLVKLYESMPSSQRRLLLTLAAKLAKSG